MSHSSCLIQPADHPQHKLVFTKIAFHTNPRVDLISEGPFVRLVPLILYRRVLNWRDPERILRALKKADDQRGDNKGKLCHKITNKRLIT
ncbi:hypothetical protein DdX_14637 [Ditylenchus destructor]|uniref:Uncharacterized protein n=1 Tax=Ditylenchus destructor TaxID=166010 RepID=A0AAD4MSG7_9BILA|nr:hypothetical protein DdX_14633 [Ditylenchus destructor]KAI1703894.1 hypothetical protein DdX_14637 [Ditylenchus destructor]